MDLPSLEKICGKIRANFDLKDAARERGLTLSREVIRNSANAIRSVHRGEYDAARALLAQNASLVADIDRQLGAHPDIYYAGFVHDAQKEYAEGLITLALIAHEPLPDPDEIKVGYAAYLGGLGEAVGELRRHILDQMRHQQEGWGEELLTAMDDIYCLLVSFDYPAAISAGLRRTTDVMRSIIEKTRGDLTNAIRQQHLEDEMRQIEARLGGGEG